MSQKTSSRAPPETQFLCDLGDSSDSFFPVGAAASSDRSRLATAPTFPEMPLSFTIGKGLKFISKTVLLLGFFLFLAPASQADITVIDANGNPKTYSDLSPAEPEIKTDDRNFPVEVVVDNTPEADGIVFCLVRGGTFKMGSTEGDPDEAPVHDSNWGHFYISKYSITNAQYEKYTKEVGISHTRGSYSMADSGPATNVTHPDALNYMEWLENKARAANGLPPKPPNPPGVMEIRMYSLPTESMWERASQGGDLTDNVMKKYPWGNEMMDDKKIYSFNGALINEVGIATNGVGIATATIVPSDWKDRGRVFHMTGNVFSWCLDWYQSDFYKNSPLNNPVGPPEDATSEAKKSPRVIRGGTWYISNRSHRITDRSSAYPLTPNERVGIRLVRTIDFPGDE